MNRFYTVTCIILTLLCFSINAQDEVSLVNSGIVSTSKKTDFVRYVLERDNGNIITFIQDYRRELSFIHEFDENMKLKKSIKLNDIRGHVATVKLDNDEVKLFTYDPAKGNGRILKVDFIKGKLEVLKKDVFDIKLKGSAWRKIHFKDDKSRNNLDERYYGNDLGFYGHGFYSDQKSYYCILYSRGVGPNMTTAFSKKEKTSRYVMVMLDNNFNFIKDFEITLKEKGFDRFFTNNVSYNEKLQTFIFNGNMYVHLPKGTKSKEKDKRINYAVKGSFFVKDKEKPRFLMHQKRGEFISDFNLKIEDNKIKVASIIYLEDYDGEENKDINIKISEYNFDTLDKIYNTQFAIPEYSFRGSINDDNIFTSLKIPLFEIEDSRYVVSLYNYKAGIAQMSARGTNIMSYWRNRGEYHVFDIDKGTSTLSNHYILDREVYVKQKREKAINFENMISGLWEYWNTGVNEIYKDGKLLLFLNAASISQDDNKITFKTSKLRKDMKFLKAKPYLVILDLNKGFRIEKLGGKTTHLNGLMVEQLAKVKEGVYITNTPDTKKKKYVKVILN